ncbi:hypothetical protein Tco_0836172 [Tanacetum coccineum]
MPFLYVNSGFSSKIGLLQTKVFPESLRVHVKTAYRVRSFLVLISMAKFLLAVEIGRNESPMGLTGQFLPHILQALEWSTSFGILSHNRFDWSDSKCVGKSQNHYSFQMMDLGEKTEAFKETIFQNGYSRNSLTLIGNTATECGTFSLAWLEKKLRFQKFNVDPDLEVILSEMNNIRPSWNQSHRKYTSTTCLEINGLEVLGHLSRKTISWAVFQKANTVHHI